MGPYKFGEWLWYANPNLADYSYSIGLERDHFTEDEGKTYDPKDPNQV